MVWSGVSFFYDDLCIGDEKELFRVEVASIFLIEKSLVAKWLMAQIHREAPRDDAFGSITVFR